MAITFGILAALIAAVSIWVGYKNGQAKDAQHEKLVKEVRKREDNEATKKNLEDRLADFNKYFVDNLEGVREQYDIRDQREQDLRDLEKELSDLKTRIAELEKEKKRYEDLIPDIGEVKRLVQRLRDTKKAIIALDKQLADLKEQNKKLTEEIAQQEETIAYNKRWMKNHSEFQAQEELNGSIKAIYKNWGFVIVNTGDAAGEGDGNVGGVTPRSMLLVKRGDEVICQLMVKTSTNNAATAEILFETMKEDDFIQIGDKVVARPKPKPEDPGAKKDPAEGGGDPDPEPKENDKPKDPFASDPFR